MLGMKPRFRRVPVGLLDGIIGALSVAGRVRPALAAKAELARIGRYYATESMLVWNGTRRDMTRRRRRKQGRTACSTITEGSSAEKLEYR